MAISAPDAAVIDAARSTAAATASATDSAFKPIFVVGNSRSGTTLMGRILGNHDAVFTFDELHFFEQLWMPSQTREPAALDRAGAQTLAARLLDIQRSGYLHQHGAAPFYDEAARVIDAGNGNEPPSSLTAPAVFARFLRYETARHGKHRPCEQTPRNVLYLQEILHHYPQARVINMVRDPRDILLSQKNRWRRPFLSDNIPRSAALRYWLNYHPITISKLWQANVRAAERHADDPRLLSVRFEDLIDAPERTVRQVCEFADLSYSPELLNVPQIGSSNTPDQPTQRGVDRGKIAAWRQGGLNRAELYLGQTLNRDYMRRYDYQPEPVKPPLGLPLTLVSFPLKLSLALLFNLNRMRRVAAAIKRRLS